MSPGHHRGLIGIAGNADEADGLVFTDRHGTPLTAAALSATPTRPPPSPAQPYEHPLGERLDRRAITFREPRAHAPPGDAA